MPSSLGVEPLDQLGGEVGESQIKPALLKLAHRKIVERRAGRFGEQALAPRHVA